MIAAALVEDGAVRAFRGDASLRARCIDEARRSSVPWGVEFDQPGYVEQVLGLPVALGRLLDLLPTLLPTQRMHTFSQQWLDVVPPGADLTGVTAAFVSWLLTDARHGAIRHASDPAVRAAIAAVAELHLQVQRGGVADRSAWSAARRAASRFTSMPSTAEAEGASVCAIDRAAAMVAAAAAWPSATSGTVAIDCLESWLQLHSEQIRAELAYGLDAEAHHDELWDAFAELHSAWIAGMQARDESIEPAGALFERHYPRESREHREFVMAQWHALQAAAEAPANQLVELLRLAGAAQPSGSSKPV